MGESKVIGAMKLDPFSCRFVKKISNWTSKECFYYVCANHYPKGEDSSDEEWPSGASDDQLDEASEDEKKTKVHKKQKKAPTEDEESDSTGDEKEGKGSSEDEPVAAGKETSDESESDTD